jgi:hypothetical protein
VRVYYLPNGPVLLHSEDHLQRHPRIDDQGEAEIFHKASCNIIFFIYLLKSFAIPQQERKEQGEKGELPYFLKYVNQDKLSYSFNYMK